MTSSISINNPSYITVSRFKLNKMISSDGVSLYRFMISNSKSIIIVKTDFFIQFYYIIRFREELLFRFIVSNIEWITCVNSCDIMISELIIFIIRDWR